jgi:hypothetical protein
MPVNAERHDQIPMSSYVEVTWKKRQHFAHIIAEFDASEGVYEVRFQEDGKSARCKPEHIKLLKRPDYDPGVDFEVEAVLAETTDRGTDLYKVHWKGYLDPGDKETWTEKENISESLRVVRSFHQRQAAHKLKAKNRKRGQGSQQTGERGGGGIGEGCGILAPQVMQIKEEQLDMSEATKKACSEADEPLRDQQQAQQEQTREELQELQEQLAVLSQQSAAAAATAAALPHVSNVSTTVTKPTPELDTTHDAKADIEDCSFGLDEDGIEKALNRIDFARDGVRNCRTRRACISYFVFRHNTIVGSGIVPCRATTAKVIPKKPQLKKASTSKTIILLLGLSTVASMGSLQVGRHGG